MTSFPIANSRHKPQGGGKFLPWAFFFGLTVYQFPPDFLDAFYAPLRHFSFYYPGA